MGSHFLIFQFLPRKWSSKLENGLSGKFSILRLIFEGKNEKFKNQDTRNLFYHYYNLVKLQVSRSSRSRLVFKNVKYQISRF